MKVARFPLVPGVDYPDDEDDALDFSKDQDRGRSTRRYRDGFIVFEPDPANDATAADLVASFVRIRAASRSTGGASTQTVAPLDFEPVKERPTIPVVRGKIHEAVDEAIDVLSDPEVGVFQRGETLVRVGLHEPPSRTLTVRKSAENVHRPEGAVGIHQIGEAALAELLTRHAKFTKWDSRAKDDVPIDCPADVSRMVIARRGDGWKMPPLRAVIQAPTLRDDGTVIAENGYDATTGLLLVSNRMWHAVPDNPSHREALDALEVLVEPVDQLPFVDNSDRAAALALLITSVLRPILPTAPMFCVTAPAAGTGKSLTIDIAAILATGRAASVVTPTPDEAELEKRIGAAMLAGDAVLSIDNVSTTLRSDQLCQFLTQSEVQVRVLGKSENIKVPSTALICATGNNLSLYGDLNRRAIRIRLDARCERPDERPFKFDARELAKRKRAELIAAALTIVRGYIAAGTPNRASPMGSFEDWSDVVRSALIWLNMGDCRGDVEAMRAEDPEKAALAEVIDVLPSGLWTVKDIRRCVKEDGDVREALASFIDRGGEFNAKRFAWYLRRHTGTIVGGRSIKMASADQKHGSTWLVSSE